MGSKTDNDQIIEYVQPCFCATCATVKPWDKSAFRRFASTGIVPKWLDLNLHTLPGKENIHISHRLVKFEVLYMIINDVV